MSDRTYDVKFCCYCGMIIPIKEDVPFDEAKQYCFGRIKRYKKRGFTVSKVKPGEWEFQDDEAFMIGDDQGILVIRRHRAKSHRTR